MSRWLRQHQLVVTAVLVTCFALWLYAPIRHYPLLYDDLLAIRLVKALNYATVWQPNPDFGYYRPLLFLPYLFTHSLFGYYPSSFIYAQNLGLHALAAALLTALAWRLWPRWPRALAAGLLFASYPFAYQAVDVAGNNVYPLLVVLVLLAGHTYLQALTGHRVWWVVTAVLFMLALLSHELAVLFGAFAALMQWAAAQRVEITQWRLRPGFHALVFNLSRSPYLLFLASGLLYILLYRFLPTAEVLPPASDSPWWPKALYWGQAAVYPLAWAGARWSMFTADVIVTGSLLIMLAFTGWAARWPRNRLALLLGWGWWGITAVLLTLTLPADYVLHGPRLTYLGSVGITLLWAVLLDALFTWRRMGQAVWALALAAMLLPGSLFVRGRMAALADLGTVVDVMATHMLPQPLAEGVLFVNLPAWSVPARPTFPVGVEIAALMGHHLFAEELVWHNLNQVRPVRAIGVAGLQQDPGYPYGIHAQAEGMGDVAAWAPAGAHVFISQFTTAGVETQYTGHFWPSEAATNQLAQMGDYRLITATAVACGDTLTLTTTWQLPGTPTPTTSLFVQALAADGRLLGQNDGPPLNLPPEMLVLPTGWLVTDRRTLPLADAPARLLIGVYDYARGDRFAATDDGGRPLPDNALPLPVTFCP